MFKGKIESNFEVDSIDLKRKRGDFVQNHKGSESIVAKPKANKTYGLKKQNEIYKSAFNVFPDAMIFVENSDTILFCNPAFEKITGYSEAELIGRKITMLRFAGMLAESYENEGSQIGFVPGQKFHEGDFQKKNGDTFSSESYCSVLKGKDGEIIGKLMFLRDVSGRKQRVHLLEENLNRVKSAIAGTIKVLAKTYEVKDPYTTGHQQNVAILATCIGKKLSLTNLQLEGLYFAAILHDIGKINVPMEILTKGTKLTDPEIAIIKTHPQVAFDLLKEIRFPWPIAQAILQHHEKMNGAGYPQGLVKDEIILEARIICVADVVETMSLHRPYRPALGEKKALEDLESQKGTLYDPDVVEACMRVFREDSFAFKKIDTVQYMDPYSKPKMI